MKNQLTIITPTIKDGKTGFGLQIQSALQALEGKRVKITIEEFKKPRSNAQNAYYYGCVLPAYKEAFAANNVFLDNDQMHAWIKEFVWEWYVDLDMNGIPFRKVLSSTHVDVKQWEELMTKCRYYATKHLNIDIQEPQEKMPEYEVPDGLYYDYDYKNYFKIVNSTAEVMPDLKEASGQLAHIAK